MEKDKYKVLDSSTNEHWSTILASYQKAENKWKLKGEGMSDVSALKRACEAQVGSEYSEELYKSFTKWCVVPRTAEDLLRDKFSLLESNDTVDTDKADWKHNVDNYESYKTKHNKYALSDVSLDGKSTEGDKAKVLKTGCKTRKGKFTYDVDLDSAMEEIKTWCLAKAS
ncbi:hypothetical protein HF1_04790 [Mycoplasma haemofelis str. Langford 1]|uniref:Uncharacterized protein n=1 Tax=Mycoplasma haemofelis (strain Langford 1) TaxID=941640 RepID=E8ZH66_MYCHL|nr:hypothetical protein HF1_04790 [Mycoplasma haemofelis str. Langford 1]